MCANALSVLISELEISVRRAYEPTYGSEEQKSTGGGGGGGGLGVGGGGLIGG